MTVISRLRKPITLGPHFHYSEWTVSDYPFEERIIHGDVVFCGYEIVRCKITVSYDKDRHALHRTIQVARRVLREAVERDLEEYIAMRSSPWTYPEAREIPMPTTETRYPSPPDLLSVCKEILEEWDAWDGFGTLEGDLKEKLALVIKHAEGTNV